MTTGERIKQYRKQQSLTLKDLGERSGLSAGYLSLIERNQTALTLVTLKRIASALNISPSVFVDVAQPSDDCVIRQDEYGTLRIHGENTFYYDISNAVTKQLRFGPQIEVILPGSEWKSVENHTHGGEEFGYILEGVLTLYVENKEFKVYPGDSFHFLSSRPHALVNMTNKCVKILYVTEREYWRYN